MGNNAVLNQYDVARILNDQFRIVFNSIPFSLVDLISRKIDQKYCGYKSC